jgi:hypothetical protein
LHDFAYNNYRYFFDLASYSLLFLTFLSNVIKKIVHHSLCGYETKKNIVFVANAEKNCVQTNQPELLDEAFGMLRDGIAENATVS